MPQADIDADQVFLAQAVALAATSLAVGGFPNGALVVSEGSVIGEGQSLVVRLADPTAHAEVNAIRDAAGRTGRAKLRGATLYSALEPCLMCLHAACWAGIERIMFGAGKELFRAEYYEGGMSLFEAVRAMRRQPEVSLLPGHRERLVELVREWVKEWAKDKG